MNARRRLLSRLAALSALGAGAGLGGFLAAGPRSAQAADYRALVCLNLNGGNDGNDTLVPTDAAYGDYQSVRSDLALPKSSLVALPGTSAGHSFGVHPGLAPLASLYAQQRLAFVANVGPLLKPVRTSDVRAGVAEVPPFLLSHSDQLAMQQGWGGDEDQSGWAGRALEALAPGLRQSLSAVSLTNRQTLVMGRHSAVTRTDPGGRRYWGPADLANPNSFWTQAIARVARGQSANGYEAEYARNMLAAFDDSTEITNALLSASEPAAQFPPGRLGEQLRFLAQLLPVFKAQGKRRQVFLIDWGQFDTHSGQRGTDAIAQDSQLAEAGAALAAFEQSLRAAGMGPNVITFMLTDFGRTLQPASGAGTDHAWGNHLFLFGDVVRGGQVYGEFPSLVLGGPSDGDPDHEGRWVPTTSGDQLGATLALWLGMPVESIPDVFPNLVHFPSPTIPLLS